MIENDKYINKEIVCCVLVTFNGETTIAQTLTKLKNNINTIVIVDNNSKDNTIEIVKNMKLDKVFIIENSSNVGIAAALNKGARYAKKLGFSWILTMDQDSSLAENVLEEMARIYSGFNLEDRERIACLAPVPITHGEIGSFKEPYLIKKYVITSGNLVRLNSLEKIGGYEEKLFIDSVDFDFCLKLGERNFLIIQCNNALMEHELGELKEVLILSFPIKIHVHSNIRKYYMSRNHIYILKRFFKSNWKFCFKKTWFFLVFIAQVILFEPNKISSLKAIILGTKHGLNNKFGELMI